ncbi:MAG: CDP-alcohol phosphatidyltransferase family protein [Candidatus Omnitrophica bacterium]|nr:CDP-alcohol phosphatidyltransferase family protein [Candidatus Omnitrophota bacterium]
MGVDPLMFTLANRLSIFRILIIPVFITTILYYTAEKDYLRLLAAGIFLLAALSDGLDGYIARVMGQRTKLGSFLDPLADKLLLAAVYTCLSLVQTLPAQFKFPAWVVIIVISRDVIILLGSAIIYMAHQELYIYPTRLGKTTTFLQMATVVILLLQLPFFATVMYIMVAFTVISGLDYIRRGSKLFNNHELAPEKEQGGGDV